MTVHSINDFRRPPRKRIDWVFLGLIVGSIVMTILMIVGLSEVVGRVAAFIITHT